MQKFLQKLLQRPVLKLANRFSSRPDKERIHTALSQLQKTIEEGNTKKGLLIPFNNNDQFIILSDQHKGCKDDADDFALAENNYLAALDYYYQNNFFYINLGDSEELWENTFLNVKKKNTATFEKEKLFAQSNRFIKIFGNHDLYWDNSPFAPVQLESIYNKKISIHEGLILQTSINNKPVEIFLTHGHQGDLQSDGNWFSKWFVANVWARLQAYLHINPNTPAYDIELKSEHNRLMYEWSSEQANTILITGHTHQPVFVSLTHLERLYQQLSNAMKNGNAEEIQKVKSQIKVRIVEGDALPDFSAVKPRYFNSGCCCFNDGDITGIEITGKEIRLIKWEYDDENKSKRVVLEEAELVTLIS